MRKGVLAFAVMVLAVAGAPIALACSCACDTSYTVENYIDGAAVIVVGRILAISPQPAHLKATDSLTQAFLKAVDASPNDLTIVSSCGEQLVRVEVEELLKGERRAEFEFVEVPVGSARDFQTPLEVGGSYLLFGMPLREGQILYLSGCSPSSPIAKARQLIGRVRTRLAEAR